MSLSSAPTYTLPSTGNLYGGSGGTSLAAGASHSTTFAFGVSSGNTNSFPGSALFGRLDVINSPGTNVATPTGLQVQVFGSADGGTNYATVPFINQTLASVASTVATGEWDLIPPGFYKVTLTNLDGTYATTVTITCGIAA